MFPLPWCRNLYEFACLGLAPKVDINFEADTAVNIVWTFLRVVKECVTAILSGNLIALNKAVTFVWIEGRDNANVAGILFSPFTDVSVL